MPHFHSEDPSVNRLRCLWLQQLRSTRHPMRFFSLSGAGEVGAKYQHKFRSGRDKVALLPGSEGPCVSILGSDPHSLPLSERSFLPHSSPHKSALVFYKKCSTFPERSEQNNL